MEGPSAVPRTRRRSASRPNTAPARSVSRPSAPPAPRKRMPAHDVLNATAAEQARLIRTGEISSEALTRLYLDRIERLNPKLNAFVLVFRDGALREARKKDEERIKSRDPLPTFHGVPIGIKD